VEKPREPFLIETWKADFITEAEREEFLKFLGPLIAKIAPPPAPSLVLRPVAALRDIWARLSVGERNIFLANYIPASPPVQTLREHFVKASAGDVAQFIRWWMENKSLTVFWNAANDKQRNELLKWLRDTGIIQNKQTLLEHWNSAEQERKAIVATIVDSLSASSHSVTLTPHPSINKTPKTPPGTLTKSEFARELGIEPSNISTYIHHRGMPQRPDGRLDREVVQAWVKANINPPGVRKTQQRRQNETPITNIDFADDEAIAALSKSLWPS
jgi:hypothetical protein